MVVAKWLPICIISCLRTILGLASVGLAFGYSYPAYPLKRATPKEPVINMYSSEIISKSERWEQPGAPKRGLDDANPTKGTTEQMRHEAEFLDRVDKMQFFKGRQTSHKRSRPIPQLQCKDGCDSYEPCEFDAKLPFFDVQGFFVKRHQGDSQ